MVEFRYDTQLLIDGKELDEEKILGMTTWDEKDKEYEEFKDCFVFDANDTGCDIDCIMVSK